MSKSIGVARSKKAAAQIPTSGCPLNLLISSAPPPNSRHSPSPPRLDVLIVMMAMAGRSAAGLGGRRDIAGGLSVLDKPMDKPLDKPTQDGRPLRIGLLVDGPQVSKYDYDFIKWAADSENIAITHLIIHSAHGAGRKKTGLPKLVRHLVEFAGQARREAYVQPLPIPSQPCFFL